MKPSKRREIKQGRKSVNWEMDKQEEESRKSEVHFLQRSIKVLVRFDQWKEEKTQIAISEVKEETSVQTLQILRRY